MVFRGMQGAAGTGIHEDNSKGEVSLRLCKYPSIFHVDVYCVIVREYLELSVHTRAHRDQ